MQSCFLVSGLCLKPPPQKKINQRIKMIREPAWRYTKITMNLSMFTAYYQYPPNPPTPPTQIEEVHGDM